MFIAINTRYVSKIYEQTSYIFCSKSRLYLSYRHSKVNQYHHDYCSKIMMVKGYITIQTQVNMFIFSILPFLYCNRSAASFHFGVFSVTDCILDSPQEVVERKCNKRKGAFVTIISVRHVRKYFTQDYIL